MFFIPIAEISLALDLLGDKIWMIYDQKGMKVIWPEECHLVHFE